MTNFTVSTDTNIDALTGKTGEDSYTVTNGATLTFDQDSRYGVNQNTSATIAWLSGDAGKVGIWKFDARKVRLIPFDSGTGNIPALNTIISQGSAQGKLIGVYTAINQTPLVSGAMPASGFIKIKQWNDVAFTSGALTGITANATGSDIVGWLEIIFAQTGRSGGSPLNTLQAYGEWYDIGLTTGTRSSTYQLPTNGSITSIGGVWVESAPGSGVYDRYPNILSAAGLTVLATDAIRGQWCWITTAGVLRLGNDGTADSGYCPASGCKIRMPNLIWQMANSADKTVNMNLTVASYGDDCFHLDEPFHADYDKVSVGFAWRATYNNSSVTVKNCSFLHAYGARSLFSRATTDNLIVGSMYAGGTQPLNIYYDSVGHLLTNSKIAVHNSCYSWYWAVAFTKAKNIEIDNLHIATITKRTSEDKGLIVFEQGGYNIKIKNSILGGGCIYLRDTTDGEFDNIGYYDNVQGDASITSASSPIIKFYASVSGVKISNLHFNGLTNAHCYSHMIKMGSPNNNIKIRNIGTASSPIDCGTVNPCNGIFGFDWNANSGPIDIKRCYSINARNELLQPDGNASQLTVRNFSMPYTTSRTQRGYDVCMYGVRGAVVNSPNGYMAGSHFYSIFTSDTAGQMLFYTVPPSEISSPYVKRSSASEVIWNDTKFSFAAGSYGWAEMECPEWIKGFTSFQAQAGLYDTWPYSESDFTLKFQVDTGSGYGGTWLLANSTNLGAITGIDPAVGFRIKIRFDKVVSTASNIGNARFLLTTSLAAQEAGLYPLDMSTLSLYGIVAGSDIVVLSAGTTTELANIDSNSGTTFSTSIDTATYTAVDICVYKCGYAPFTLRNIAMTGDLSVPINQVPDRNYTD